MFHLLQCFLIMRRAPATDTSALVLQIAETTVQVIAAIVSLAFMATGRNVLLRVRSYQYEFIFTHFHHIYIEAALTEPCFPIYRQTTEDERES